MWPATRWSLHIHTYILWLGQKYSIIFAADVVAMCSNDSFIQKKTNIPECFVFDWIWMDSLEVEKFAISGFHQGGNGAKSYKHIVFGNSHQSEHFEKDL